MGKTLTCPKCAGTMIEGFVPDFSDETYNRPVSWVEGEPEKSFWSGTKIKDKDHLPVKTYCCRKCGFLEFYAG
ncbi:MAG TPA: PF20097 family protein [Pyrinomonadaceae bacterium]|jgi:hypothetical protein